MIIPQQDCPIGAEWVLAAASALSNSVCPSGPEAALYWLARMLETGKCRLYIGRLLVRMASEDISLTGMRVIEETRAAQQAVHFHGIPEGDQALAQAAIYLSVAPKSSTACRALNGALDQVRQICRASARCICATPSRAP